MVNQPLFLFKKTDSLETFSYFIALKWPFLNRAVVVELSVIKSTSVVFSHDSPGDTENKYMIFSVEDQSCTLLLALLLIQ